MLKLAVLAAIFAAVVSTPIYPGYVPSPYFGGIGPDYNPFNPVVYPYPVPFPYINGEIPSPYLPPLSLNLRSHIQPYKKVEKDPVMADIQVPIYIPPEHHSAYEAAVAKLNPLEYAAKLEDLKEQQALKNKKRE